MNREQLSDAIGRLDEALVGSVMMPRCRPWWQIAVAVAACAALVVGAVAVWPLIGPDGQRPPMEPSHGNVTTTASEQGGTEEEQTTDTTVGSVSEPSDTTDREPSDSTTDGGDVEPSMKPTAKPSMQRPTAGTKDTTAMKNPNGSTTIKTTAPTIKTTATKATKNTGGGVRGTKTTIRKGTTTGGGQSDSVVKRLAYPTYPEMVQRPYDSFGADYDAWDESVKKQRDQIKGQTDGMTDFYRRTISAFLNDESGVNRVYSPLNVYLALSMLAETTEGESRQQILDLLGVSKLSTLRKKNAALWNGVYLDDGAVLCRLANSLWLDDYMQGHYEESTADALAKYYYASVYAGKMGSETYNEELRNWVNEQTDGLLKNHLGSLRFHRDTVLGLASTICFKARWYEEFSTEDTEKGVFYTSKGKKTSYYLRAETAGSLWQGDHFTALPLLLDDDYKMLFFRPDEGVSANDLVQDEQVLELMQGNRSNLDGIYDFIDISIPKFDVVSDLELSDELNKLGVTDIFDDKTSDFGGILDDRYDSAYLGQMQHAARVKIDEEGVEAAAYTIIPAPGSPTPKDPIEFKLDRPFVFAITGPGNTVLFAGVVENP